MKDKTIRIPLFQDETWISIEGNNIRSIYKSFEQLEEEGALVTGQDEEDWSSKDVFSNITQRDVLTLYAMSVPRSLSTEGIEDYEKYALLVSDGTMNGKRYFVGTIKLMTPQQIQDYQHRYVVQHHLDDDFDPTFTTRPKNECSSKEDSYECGNPAALYPANLLIPLVIPEGQIYFPLPADSVFERAPKYLYRIGRFGQRSWDSDDFLIYRGGKPADNSFAEMLKPYDAKRVLLDVNLWYDQYGRPLPGSSWNIVINSVVATLPDSPSQTK